MPRYVYVNGRYVPHDAGVVHIEDRGYQFADGVYEVVPLFAGRLIEEEWHLDRLDYSLHELRIAWPISRAALKLVQRELVRRNGVDNGLLYLQVTRGVAPRDHRFPERSRPALVMTTRRMGPGSPALVDRGVSVVTRPDIRWRRCDIKSVSLLPNILAKQQAAEAGAYEAWLVDADGYVTEGASTNAWIVIEGARVVTRERSAAILSGITRRAMLDLIKSEQIVVDERRFTVAEAKSASEAFLSSSSSFILPVTRIDGMSIGDGKPGRITLRLRELYMAHVRAAGTA